MIVAPELLSCQVNMIYFVKNHEILVSHFENEEQLPWKHHFNCRCNYCNFYFLKNKCKFI